MSIEDTMCNDDISNYNSKISVLGPLTDASRRRGDDHVTKSRNRKLIRVTSSNEGLKQMCVDLSDYNIYLNQIWY